MATYVSTKCGVCGSYWEYNEQGRHMSFGPPIVKCSFCGSLIKTKFKLFRDMNILEKIWFLSGQVLLRFALGIGASYGIYYIVKTQYIPMWNDINLAGKIITGLILLVIGLWGVFTIFDTLFTNTNIKDVENEFDKNGGYITSESWYKHD